MCMPPRGPRIGKSVPLFRRYQGKAIFGGDFNCVIDKNESGGRGICLSLAKVVNELKFKDTWLTREKSHGFTFRSAGASRIDRVYVSDCYEKCIKSVFVYPVPFSDHCAMGGCFDLGLDCTFRSRGLWKLNAAILDDADFLPEFRVKRSEWKKAQKRYNNIVGW